MQVSTVWRLKMLDLLRRIFEFLNGNPLDLIDVDEAIPVVVDRYQTKGIPEPLSSQQKVTGLDEMSELSAALSSPANDLTEQQNTSLIDLQADMTTDIINSP